MIGALAHEFRALELKDYWRIMFDTLNNKFEKIVQSIKGKAVISESDLDLTLREIRIALLEADVSLIVVKDFINSIKSNILGKEILKSVKPDQMIIKLVQDELIKILGSENKSINFSSSHNLWVLEDCAQAHLASINSICVGSFGSAASFSFYPGKNLGAMGDAGCITTNDSILAEKMTMFCRHGGLTKGQHLIEGINSRMDSIQASILSIKLKKLPQWTERRRFLANRYIHELSNLDWLSSIVPHMLFHLHHRMPEHDISLRKHQSRCLHQSFQNRYIQSQSQRFHFV